jgi:hypothetical protein
METVKLDFYVVLFEYFRVGFTVSQCKTENSKDRRIRGGVLACGSGWLGLGERESAFGTLEARQSFQEHGNDSRNRDIPLRSPDSRLAVGFVGYGYGDVFHGFIDPRFHCAPKDTNLLHHLRWGQLPSAGPRSKNARNLDSKAEGLSLENQYLPLKMLDSRGACKIRPECSRMRTVKKIALNRG